MDTQAPMFTPTQPTLVTAKIADIEPWQAKARSTVTKSVVVLGFASTPLLQELENSDSLDPKDKYRYKVIAGRRRLDAAVAAGMTNVPALALSAEVGEAEALALALSSNLARSPSPIDEAEELRGLIARGHSPEGLAKLLGIPKGTIAKRLKLLSLPEPLLAAVKEKGLAVGLAANAANLNDEQQGELLERLEEKGKIDGKDLKEVRLASKEAAVNALPEGLFVPYQAPTVNERFIHSAQQALQEGSSVEELTALLEQAAHQEVL